MADQGISTIVRFDNRNLTTLTECNIRIMFDEYPFDMNLIAANDKKVPVHFFVMMMFSPYIRQTSKNELSDQPNTDVPLTDFSYEVLCDVVIYIYYGEVAVRNEVKAQFSHALNKLNIVGPLCYLEHSESDKESDGEGYKELVRDNGINLFDCDQKIRQRHKRPDGNMPYTCETSGCKVNFFTKVVDGKTMIKVVHAIHSKKFEKQDKQQTTPQSGWSDLLRDIAVNNVDTSSSGLSNKPPKKGAKQSSASVVCCQKEEIDE